MVRLFHAHTQPINQRSGGPQSMKADGMKGEEMALLPAGNRNNRPLSLSQRLHEVELHANPCLSTVLCLN